MGRWTQYDEDEYRLPEGMQRVGYDSDTGKYYFRDSSGALYEGPEGAQFGELRRVSDAPIAVGSSVTHDEDDSIEAEALPRRSDGYHPLATDANARLGDMNEKSLTAAYRSILPFCLMIGVVLLLVWRYIVSPNVFDHKPLCAEGTVQYLVEPGDSCWEISRAHSCPLEELQRLNSKVNCDRLMPGTALCLPQPTTES